MSADARLAAGVDGDSGAHSADGETVGSARRAPRLTRFVKLPFWRRMSRYTAGSVICFGVSELTLVLLFWPHLLGARGAALTASIVGIIPGYFLNRSWTWGRRGRSDLWREVVPYWATAIGSALVAAFVIGAVNGAFSEYSRDARTFINAAAYFVTYGAIFVGKYLLFDLVLFRPQHENAALTRLDEPAEPRDHDAAIPGRTSE